ncbi:MAG: flavin reductase [Oscillospiraceae bacterium]|nr:flavin reductase [Oscillospiraceae bacterium]
MSYGLYVLTAGDASDNGCIIDAAAQVANDPARIAISVQMGNYTREIIEKTGKFNLSVLTEDAPFEVFKRFGMQSGRDVDKFQDFTATKRSHNGLLYVTENTNAFMSCKVVSQSDLGSHMLFVGEVTESKVLSDKPSITYAQYRKNLKK